MRNGIFISFLPNRDKVFYLPLFEVEEGVLFGTSLVDGSLIVVDKENRITSVSRSSKPNEKCLAQIKSARAALRINPLAACLYYGMQQVVSDKDI